MAKTSATVNFSVVVDTAGSSDLVVVSMAASDEGLDLMDDDGRVRVLVWLGLVDRSSGLSGLARLRLLGEILLMTTGVAVVSAAGDENLDCCLKRKGDFNLVSTFDGIGVDFSSFSSFFSSAFSCFSTTACSKSRPCKLLGTWNFGLSF